MTTIRVMSVAIAAGVAMSANLVARDQLKPLEPSPRVTTVEAPKPSVAVAAAPPAEFAAAAAAPMPSYVGVQPSMTSEQDFLERKLRRIDDELREVALGLAGFQRGTAKTALDIFNIIAAGGVPLMQNYDRDDGAIRQLLERSRNLSAERRETSRRLAQIVDPGTRMYPAPVSVGARDGSTPSNAVEVSDDTARGAVTIRCYWTTVPKREWRLIAKPAGFGGDGTPQYHYVWEAFTAKSQQEVCQ